VLSVHEQYINGFLQRLLLLKEITLT